MIHEIRIANFYSIRDEIVLDLRIPKNAPPLPRFRPSWSRPDIRLPTVVVLFGANAAGKSVVLRALTSTVAFVCRSFDLGIRDFQAFMHRDAVTKPVRVSIEFDAGWLSQNAHEPESQLFRYQLELVSLPDGPSPKEVGYEALFHFPHGKPRRLFERKKDEPIYVAREFDIRPTDARLRSVRPDSSVIATLAKLNNALAIKIWTDLMRLQSNLSGLVRTDLPTESVLQHYAENPALLDKLNRELRRFDVGISRMELHPGPPRLFAWFRHDGLEVPILMAEESSGTRHFVHMFPRLDFVLSSGHIAVFDEFDADLHPDLARELFGWFQAPDRNPYGAQILVSAHNTALLDCLEKEEVFLVEKNADGASRLYGAQDVQGLRRETSLYNKYMGGALGGLPRIG